ncbi:MAG: hypothetical protein Q7S12_03195 [bacterium]|nr:hypothetical protein [bacterium]
MRKDPLITGEIYHICNRSTEGIPIFSEKADAKRFLSALAQSNTTGLSLRGARRMPNKIFGDGSSLVEIYAITLMPNHFHICVKQLENNGITLWMHRTCNSFAKYFNIINERKGSLFMGRFKAVPITENRQLFHVLVYINANPLDLYAPGWRKGKINNWNAAKSFLNNYSFSSFGLVAGSTVLDENIKKLIFNNDFIKSFTKEYGGIENGVRDWSSRITDEYSNIFLE